MGRLCMIIGIVGLIGTAGSCDIESINLNQIIVQSIICSFLILGGYLWSQKEIKRICKK